MYFGSDNWAGAAPEIMNALAAANEGMAPAYGDDPLTNRTTRRIAEIFETDCEVFLVGTGGAANGLALASLCPPYGTVLCHASSHIQTDECGGPEFFTGGAKLLGISGPNGKVTPQALEATISEFPNHPPHSPPFAAISLTQGTECGTLYSLSELGEISEVAKRHDLAVHMDGARFANAAVSSGSSPAELTWRTGVDVLSFGGTKNGCIAAEAVVFFNRALARDFALKRKRSGHLISKMRFVSAQFEAYLEGDLWLKLASHANEMAGRLSAGLQAIEGVEICYPTQINEVFAKIPKDIAAALRKEGAVFFPWVIPGIGSAENMNRLIASFKTTESDVDDFVALAAQASTNRRQR